MQGGKTFSTPLFDNGLYCRWARGVLMVDTVNFTEGQYIFEVSLQQAIRCIESMILKREEIDTYPIYIQ